MVYSCSLSLPLFLACRTHRTVVWNSPSHSPTIPSRPGYRSRYHNSKLRLLQVLQWIQFGWLWFSLSSTIHFLSVRSSVSCDFKLPFYYTRRRFCYRRGCLGVVFDFSWILSDISVPICRNCYSVSESVRVCIDCNSYTPRWFLLSKREPVHPEGFRVCLYWVLSFWIEGQCFRVFKSLEFC